MANRRITIPGTASDWVDINTVPNHAQSRRIRRARVDPDYDLMTETTAAFISNWYLHDVHGEEIPFPGSSYDGVPAEALDRWPETTTIEVFSVAAEVFAGEPDPKGTAGTSESS